MVDLVMIVEGDGDVLAAPILVRRILHHGALFDTNIPRPIRVRRDQFLRRRDQMERYLLLARAKAGADGRVLVLLDADDECPRNIAAQYLADMRDIVAPTALSLVLAKTEFETWFIAAADSIAGKCGLQDDIVPPVNSEGIGGAKGWLRRHMPPARGYSETVDQPALAASFDWETGRQRSSSLDKMCREILQ